jgi:hypothetical protein
MKAPAVPWNQQQRKEALRKEKAMSTPTNSEERDRGPEACLAAIYLCGPEPGDADQFHEIAPIPQQRMHCRCLAAVMNAEVVGEFVDEAMTRWRPGLYEATMLAARGKPVNYPSCPRWTGWHATPTQMFGIAWRLGSSGTGVLAADEHRVPLWFEM